MLNLQSNNLNNLFDLSMSTLMEDPTSHDAVQTPRILSYNNVLRSTSLEFNFDLSHVGFTKIRWPRYCHQYLDKDSLKEWLDGLGEITRRGENLFRSKDMVRRPREHRHGSCWIALSYRDIPPTVVLYSRVAEFPTRAILELTLVHKVGVEISKRLGHKLSDIHLTWFISSTFLSCLHLLPYLERNGNLMEVYEREDSVGSFVRHQLDHINRGKVKYGPAKRMAKRILQIREGTTIPVPIKKLSLWV